ncbi:glycosyltransferase family 2 protein [Mucilaginibacter robiniae]|uniref:Glycosyltransferase family 2 protein n=1 Tax=Mucilaginibacter robiniae TaxID=2728022 RepID=A0A7L5E4S6_9SPHI|nr:glycosyltransferase family A protein [Mucilaginibacter robiniae]QJD95326.1 glycosyltransferase family 2 protein [Mucilaginibacter robiniae]
MANSIDIIIPSFRLDERYLLPMLNLTPPEGFIINYYVVADNPKVKVPDSIQQLSGRNDVHLLINEQNLGFSRTRNKGIDAGQGHWILLLDDDVTPEKNLLQAYAQEISLQPEAIGFVGVTEFPPPINTVTQALQITGVSTHFQRARHEPEMYWSATANVMLNRSKLGNRRFLPELTKSTEDMELLFRNAQANHLQKYQAVPNAIVHHPWWGNGRIQTRRLFLYGEGAGEAARLLPIQLYTHYDFTNTLETLLLLTVALLLAFIGGWSPKWVLIMAIAQALAEFTTNYYRTIKIGHTYSLNVAWQVTLHKNVMEAGRLWSWLRLGRIQELGLRTDGSFHKPHPQAFRLNRWKIIKLIIFLLLVMAISLIYTS